MTMVECVSCGETYMVEDDYLDWCENNGRCSVYCECTVPDEADQKGLYGVPHQ